MHVQSSPLKPLQALGLRGVDNGYHFMLYYKYNGEFVLKKVETSPCISYPQDIETRWSATTITWVDYMKTLSVSKVHESVEKPDVNVQLTVRVKEFNTQQSSRENQ